MGGGDLVFRGAIGLAREIFAETIPLIVCLAALTETRATDLRGMSGDASELMKVVGAVDWMSVSILGLLLSARRRCHRCRDLFLLTTIVKGSSCSLKEPRTAPFDWSVEASKERAFAECLPLTTDGKGEPVQLIAGVAALTNSLMELMGTTIPFSDRN
ncbi:hypothetical protein EVAR_79566_1 [Eumeta japonica]|uniref:Uncharacterized protein n=1 Tax=Eumeta variegata TaxID=151549 RepID=A0A4C1UEG1_EUMVA|nr:hypothetical protein EVAR_79566_1 [Eumeta japonica]